MSFIFRHRQHGTVLALIALALQIVLTFGHVHLHGLSGTSHRVLAGQAAHPPLQAPAQSPSDGDDYCAICATIFLASSSFAPAPPQLLVPTSFQPVEHCFNVARPVAESLRLAFRSRAPPLA